MGSGNGSSSPTENIDQMGKWKAFAESFELNSSSSFKALNGLNEELATKSVILGHGVKPSDFDAIVFSAIYPSVIGLQDSDRKKLPHVLRWMDYIQNVVDLGKKFEKIVLGKSKFDPQWEQRFGVASDAKNTDQSSQARAKNPEAEQSTKKSGGKKATGNKESSQEKKETEKAKKDEEVSVSLLKIQVGLINKAWKHPSADSLLVEEIDVGEAKLRQVVSGLAKFCSPEELTNRRVVLITNVKPGKLRDVMSEGLVLCASSEDHTVVEPLLPPEGAKPGECISFSGIDGKPEDVLNPKKKQLDKITPHLFTDENGVATYKGIPFMTSMGPCTSSIAKASIK